MHVCVRRYLVTPLKVMRQHGALFLIVNIFRWIWWKYLTFRVRRLYFASLKKQRTPSSSDDEGRFVEEIATHGLQIISEVKRKYADRYSDRDDLRFLFNMISPEGGAQHFYFLDLAQCLQHAGVKVHLHTASAENLEQVLSDFRPNVFITGDGPSITQTLDTEALARYKERHGLARLFVPYYSSPLPKAGKASPSKESSQRMSLHRNGRLADAFICYFEDVFWDVFCEARNNTGLDYFSVPFAANPLRHYPTRVGRDLDWAIATANTDLGDRAKLTLEYMSRIIRKYHGAIVGYRWGKGIGSVPADQIAEFFSRARISPNIAAKSNVRYHLDCGAKVHELSAMGIFQLASEMQVLRKYYSADEIVAVRNPDEFNALFDYFVHKPEVRLMYVKNSLRRTLAENTYFHRIEKLIEVLDRHPELFGK